jgi:pilus assembly protein CpaB
MNNRAVTISILMAIIAVFFVQSYVSDLEKKARKSYGDDVLVVVAKHDVKEMATIDETMLDFKLIPKLYLEPSAIFFQNTDNRDEAQKEMKTLAGAVAVVPIKEGEQISRNKVTEPSLRTGLSPQVTPGRRAVALPVNEVTGVSKLVKPGDRVDVIAVMDPGLSTAAKVVRTILQDVVVLAVGRNVTNNVPRTLEKDTFNGKAKVTSLTSFDGFASITVEVEPVQAQLLALVLANANNTISLSLRNNDDSDRVALGAMQMGDVLGIDPASIQKSRIPAQTR